MRDRRENGDDRAVSVTVGYVLTLAISSLLLSGLFIAGGSFVESEREAAARGELTVVGERVAADLMTVDRLVATAESPAALTVDRTADLPDRVSGVGYRITVSTAGRDGTVTLESDRAGVVVEVPFRASAGVDVETTSVEGGELRIHWDPDAGADGAVVVDS